MTKVGFLGVGTMGAPMAARLVGGGHDVHVFDLDRARVDELVSNGAMAATSPAAVADGSDVVFVSLPSASALEAAVLDADSGVIAAMRAGGTLVDLSTNSRALTTRVADACAAHGVKCIDAPVSAISGPAAEGKLTVMVGGQPDDIEAVRPLLELIGTHIVLLGPPGSGAVGKLVTQYLGLTNMVAGMEAMLMAAKADVNMEAVLDLVQQSIGQSHMFVIVRRLAETHDFGEPGKINGVVEIMNKDLSFAVELADELGVPHPTGAGAHSVFQEAMQRGYEKYHFSRVAQSLEEAAGIEIRIAPLIGKDAS